MVLFTVRYWSIDGWDKIWKLLGETGSAHLIEDSVINTSNGGRHPSSRLFPCCCVQSPCLLSLFHLFFIFLDTSMPSSGIPSRQGWCGGTWCGRISPASCCGEGSEGVWPGAAGVGCCRLPRGPAGTSPQPGAERAPPQHQPRRGRGQRALRAGPGNLALLPASGFFRNVRSLSFSRGKLPGGFAISCNHCIEALDSLVAPSAVLSEGAAPPLPPAPGGRVGGPGAAPRAAQRPSW